MSDGRSYTHHRFDMRSTLQSTTKYCQPLCIRPTTHTHTSPDSTALAKSRYRLFGLREARTYAANRSVATADPAAVRIAVRYVPPITQIGIPNTGSSNTIIAGTVGRPCAAFFGRTDTIFRPSESEPTAAGLKSVAPSSGVLPLIRHRSGTIAAPFANSANACAFICQH